jgi:hypothetical protein
VENSLIESFVNLSYGHVSPYNYMNL